MKYSILTFVFISILSCSGSKTFVTPYYVNKKITDKSLLVASISNELIIENPNDIEDDLGLGKPKVSYLSFFQNRIKEYILSVSFFADVKYKQVQSSEFEERELILEMRCL